MKKIVLSSLVASLLVASSNIELNLNNDTVEFQGNIGLNDKYMLSEDSNYYINVRYLYIDDKNNFIDNRKLVSAGFKIESPYYNDGGVKFGLGLSFLTVDNTDKTFTAMPIDLYADIVIFDKTSISLKGGYSPNVLTFADGENYKEINARINYQIIDNVDIFAGYRNIKTKYTKETAIDELELDRSAYFGAKVSF